jgi:uncharacterized membrane protein (UPF0136 family)
MSAVGEPSNAATVRGVAVIRTFRYIPCLMDWKGIVWGYVVLLAVGGIMGFVKAGSRASLIASTAIGGILAILVVAGVGPLIVAGVLLALAFYFASKYLKTKKMMPGGIFAVVSAAAAVAVGLLKP